jgi:hypothetical protein
MLLLNSIKVKRASKFYHLGQLITTENANGVWQHVTFKFFEAGKMLQ